MILGSEFKERVGQILQSALKKEKLAYLADIFVHMNELNKFSKAPDKMF